MTIVRKTIPSAAVQYTGMNFEEMRDFIPENLIELDKPSKTVFRYVGIKGYGELNLRDWVVYENDQYIVCNDETFNKLYKEYIPPKKNKTMSNYIGVFCVSAEQNPNGTWTCVTKDGFSRIFSNAEFEKFFKPVEFFKDFCGEEQ